jgi:hypothetical protein
MLEFPDSCFNIDISFISVKESIEVLKVKLF